MNQSFTINYTDFLLPTNVVTKIDVSKMVAEVEHIDNELTEASARARTGINDEVKPVLSDQLTDFMRINSINADSNQIRGELIKQLRLLKDKAPVIHMTFAVTADRGSLQQIVTWLRESIHPQAIVSIGLQPSLVAGVYVRTPNKVHDLSVRAALNGRRDILANELNALMAKSNNV